MRLQNAAVRDHNTVTGLRKFRLVDFVIKCSNDAFTPEELTKTIPQNRLHSSICYPSFFAFFSNP